MKKRTGRRTPARTGTELRATKSLVVVLGDGDLVLEYTQLCEDKGFAVLSLPNVSESPQRKGRSASRQAIPPDAAIALELTTGDADAKRRNVMLLDSILPPTCALVSTSLTVTATEQASWITQKHRLIGFGALAASSRASLVEIAPTVFTPLETVDVVRRFFGALGKEMELVQDRVGLVFPRLMCHTVNEAAFLLEEDVAAPADIDLALRLGAGFPEGAFAWADRVGFHNVLAVLRALQSELSPERYRISPLLKQLGQTGRWWNPEAGAVPPENDSAKAER